MFSIDPTILRAKNGDTVPTGRVTVLVTRVFLLVDKIGFAFEFADEAHGIVEGDVVAYTELPATQPTSERLGRKQRGGRRGHRRLTLMLRGIAWLP